MLAYMTLLGYQEEQVLRRVLRLGRFDRRCWHVVFAVGLEMVPKRQDLRQLGLLDLIDRIATQQQVK